MMKFIVHDSTGGTPISNYNSRLQRKELARHRTFIQKLHKENFTIDDILRILANLSENSCHPSRAQLFSEMQKWGLTRYEGRRSKRSFASVPRIQPKIYSIADAPTTQARTIDHYKLWDQYFFEMVYRLSVPEKCLEDPVHDFGVLSKVIAQQLAMLEIAHLAHSVPSRSVCLGLALFDVLFEFYHRLDGPNGFLIAYPTLARGVDDGNNELARSCDLIFRHLERCWTSRTSVSAAKHSEASPHQTPITEASTLYIGPGVDEGMFLFMDMVSRAGMYMPPDGTIEKMYDTRPIRQRLFVQLANIPTMLLMWMAGGLEKYSPRTAGCVLALLLNRLIKDSDTDTSELATLEKDWDP